MPIDASLLQNSWILALLVLWTLPWKGAALWRAAKNNSMPWFIVLFIVNTIGILEILYLFVFSKRTKIKTI